MNDDKLNELNKTLVENTQELRAIQTEIVKIKKFIFWDRIMSLLRLLIIVVPLVLGIIYLPPLIDEVLSNFPFYDTGGTAERGWSGWQELFQNKSE
ncbi:MAG: hypothetical protein NUV82_02965 [Candidatus Komeilibacteria bacterium]|nr:hypothetical protein [Candidatus Komeilibacteria bacterium]